MASAETLCALAVRRASSRRSFFRKHPVHSSQACSKATFETLNNTTTDNIWLYWIQRQCPTLLWDARFATKQPTGNWSKYVRAGELQPPAGQGVDTPQATRPTQLSVNPAVQALQLRLVQDSLVLHLVRWAAAETAAGAIARESILGDPSWDMVGALQRAAVQCRASGEYGAAQWASQVSARHTAVILRAALHQRGAPNPTDPEQQGGTHTLVPAREHVACEAMLLLGTAADLSARPYCSRTQLQRVHETQRLLMRYAKVLRRELHRQGLLRPISADQAGASAGASCPAPPCTPLHPSPLSPFTTEMANVASPAMAWQGKYVPLEHRDAALGVLGCLLYGSLAAPMAEGAKQPVFGEFEEFEGGLLDAEPLPLPILRRLPTADEFATLDSCVLHCTLGERGIMPLPAAVLHVFLGTAAGIPGLAVVGAPGRVVAGLHGPTAARQLLAAGAAWTSSAVQQYATPPAGLDSPPDAVAALDWDGTGTGNNIKCSSFIDVFQYCTPRSRGALLFSLRILPSLPDSSTPWLTPLAPLGTLTRMCNNLHASISGGDQVHPSEPAGPVLAAFDPEHESASLRLGAPNSAAPSSEDGWIVPPLLGSVSHLVPVSTCAQGGGEGVEGGVQPPPVPGMLVQTLRSVLPNAGARNTIERTLQKLVPDSVPGGLDRLLPVPLGLFTLRRRHRGGDDSVDWASFAALPRVQVAEQWAQRAHIVSDDALQLTEALQLPRPVRRLDAHEAQSVVAFAAAADQAAPRTAQAQYGLAVRADVSLTACRVIIAKATARVFDPPLHPPAHSGAASACSAQADIGATDASAFVRAVQNCVLGAGSATEPIATATAASAAVAAGSGAATGGGGAASPQALRCLEEHIEVVYEDMCSEIAALSNTMRFHDGGNSKLERAAPNSTRNTTNSTPLFCPGMAVLHRRHGYMGVITGADSTCEAPVAWRRHMGVSPAVAAKPFYHVLVDARTFHGQEAATYVAECNIQLLPPDCVLHALHQRACSICDGASCTASQGVDAGGRGGAFRKLIGHGTQAFEAISANTGVPAETLLRHLGSMLQGCVHLCLGFSSGSTGCTPDENTANRAAEVARSVFHDIGSAMPGGSVESDDSWGAAVAELSSGIGAAVSFGDCVSTRSTVLEMMSEQARHGLAAVDEWQHSQLSDVLLLGESVLPLSGDPSRAARLLGVPRPSVLWEAPDTLRKLVAWGAVLWAMHSSSSVAGGGGGGVAGASCTRGTKAQ